MNCSENKKQDEKLYEGFHFLENKNKHPRDSHIIFDEGHRKREPSLQLASGTTAERDNSYNSTTL